MIKWLHSRTNGRFGGSKESQSDTTNRKWKKKADRCRKFDLVNSKIQTIWKNRTKIFTAFEENGFREPERIDVDKSLLK